MVEPEEEKVVFSVNTTFSRCERHPVKEVCKILDWNESRTEHSGSLFWFIDAMNAAQKKMIKQNNAYFNRYPKLSIVCMKRDFHILLKKHQTLFPSAYDFIPETYILPEDIRAYKRHLDTKKNPILLAKPSRGRGGQGIFFVKDFKDLDQDSMKEYEYVVQHYIPNPYLIENKKFDFRMYLLIKGVEDMEAYIAFEGLVRFCTEEYVDPKARADESDENEEEILNGSQGDNMMGHLTNYCLNKDSDKYVNNNNFKETDDGTKRLLSNVLKVMKAKGVDIDKFKSDVKDICGKLVHALKPFIVNSYHSEMGYEEQANQNCFHILGLDLMLDSDLKCWILEINCFPSFSYFFDRVVINPETKRRQRIKQISELDRYLKTLLLQEAFLLVKGDIDQTTGVYEKVYPQEGESEEQEKFMIYDNIRKVFEYLCMPQVPDYLNLAQFLGIPELGSLRHEVVLKPDYLTTVFKEYAKGGNKSLMNLNQFNKAIDHIAKQLFPSLHTKLKRLCKIMEKIND